MARRWRGRWRAELYNPVFQDWSTAGSPVSPRAQHAAVLLPNGKVLVMGGITGVEVLRSATLLSNGEVLVVGGYGDLVFHQGAELYDPVTGTRRIEPEAPAGPGEVGLDEAGDAGRSEGERSCSLGQGVPRRR